MQENGKSIPNDIFVIVDSIARSAGSENSCVNDPGVSLRSTPGFMPSSAPRTRSNSTLHGGSKSQSD